jgi:hypothetical protein
MNIMSKLELTDWTKEEAVWYLYRAEVFYLIARGWNMLAGHPDEKYYLSPLKDNIYYSHEEAINIQKQKDK